MTDELQDIAGRFEIPGRFVGAERIDIGHINDTYAASYECSGRLTRYVHQRINHHVFKKPAEMMSNIERVLAHLKRKRDERGGSGERLQILELVPAVDGHSSYRDQHGYFWRTYVFVDGVSCDVVDNPAQVRDAAGAFGEFQRDLRDLPPPRLNETIPDFHNTVKRFRDFEAACETDTCNRAATAKAEIAFSVRRKKETGILPDLLKKNELPERVTHNDTKLNNILFSRKTGRAVCVIDLDTIMPGSALYDFGDFVRTMTCTRNEDERDISKISVDMSLFRAVVRGYLSATGDFLTACEREHLVFAGKLITFETGLRFLTDYLSGDTYFKTSRPGHNLDRCRAQFKLVESIEQHEEAMESVVQGL